MLLYFVIVWIIINNNKNIKHKSFVLFHTYARPWDNVWSNAFANPIIHPRTYLYVVINQYFIKLLS